MLNIINGKTQQLTPELISGLGLFRYKIFVEKMAWPLQCEPGLEYDEFDRDDTHYVIAQDGNGHVCGCARLLSTMNDYLLEQIFPELMGDIPLPKSPDIWELSRFAFESENSSSGHWLDTCRLMKQIVALANRNNVKRLIAFSALGNERLLRRMGVDVHRVSSAQLIDGKPVLAFWVEINDKTINALSVY
ncbi:GNAT family N-acetyltransferase [Pseudomonas sp. MG-9]|uniref:Acyl-homoserine-lactone synthase n=2 Tax=Pseudomonas TaxID=286 RepID=A0ABY7ZD20_9PSED|nr:acyl-homoserine-lactone synthase [Pseudomonas serboccidentalis]MBT9268252.1 GNAT family N-acetyltransferase [Pseudomonas sp. MG-9]WDR37634.1 GNAT family N-acetyltransferase [Pseudomonas serboccidentalis]